MKIEMLNNNYIFGPNWKKNFEFMKNDNININKDRYNNIQIIIMIKILLKIKKKMI